MTPRVATAVIAAVLAVSAAAPAAIAAPASRVYVALGDSFTAGPLVPRPTGDPIDCGRSTNNYPAIVARAIHPSAFTDISCGSAQTRHMTEPQGPLPLGGTNRPQFDALHHGVGLVTVGIGGNDMGFGGIVEKCVDLALRNAGLGRPCTEHYNQGGVDEIARRIEERVAPRLARVLQGIHARSPNARVVVVGDPDPVPQDPGCFPVVPVARGDLPYLHRIARNLHEMKKRVAPENGAEFVDLLTGSFGHDFCQLPPRKWYEGIVPTEPAYPAHPNIRGMQFAAREVLKGLRRPIPNDYAVLGRRTTPRGHVILRLRAPYRGAFGVLATARRAGNRGRLIRYGSADEFARRAGAVSVRLRPGRAGRGALRRGGRIRVRMRISFDPVAGGGVAHATTIRVGVGRLTIGATAGYRSARPGGPALRVRVRARGVGMRRVRVLLRDRRGRVFARSRRFRLRRGRRRTVRVRLVRRLRPGHYVFRAAGRGHGGALVRESKRIVLL